MQVCEWQFLCQLCRMHRQTWCVVIWSHLRILKERESTRVVFTHTVCDIVSHRIFSNYFIIYSMKKYELYNIIIISPAPDRERRCRCMYCQSSHGTCMISLISFFLRLAFLETADQTSPSDYQPIVIGNRSIGAPLAKTTEKTLLKVRMHVPLLKRAVKSRSYSKQMSIS